MSVFLEQVPVRGATASITAATVDGRPFVPLKPLCESLGIDVDGQRQKLERAEWAVTEKISATGADGKTYQMVALDADHVPMWLATIQPNRVRGEARGLLVQFQREAAGALRDYFYRGGAINPRATEFQMRAVIAEATSQMYLCQAAKGVVDPDHLEARARVVLARGLGEAPVLDQSRKPLYVQDFLRAKNLSSAQLKKVAGTFGKRVKAAFILKYGRDPLRYPLNLPNGQVKEVYAYTEADRGLLDQVWREHYARPQLVGVSA